jgi:hypothetical protein
VSTRNKIVKIYYHRFEIEEAFKDMKHLFELKHAQFYKPQSLKMLLWLVMLGIAALYAVTKPTQSQLHSGPPKKAYLLASPGLRTITAGLRPAYMG